MGKGGRIEGRKEGLKAQAPLILLKSVIPYPSLSLS